MLPHKLGRCYRTNHENDEIITFIQVDNVPDVLYSEQLCLYFLKKTGIASGTPYKVIEDLGPMPDTLESIRAEHDAMMQKLADLQTPPRKEEI